MKSRLNFMYYGKRLGCGKKLGYTRVTWHETWLTFRKEIIIWKLEKRELHKSLSKLWQILAKDFLVCSYFASFLWTGIMLVIFKVSGKTPWLSGDLKICTRGSVIESPHNWIMWIGILSNLWAFVGFNDLIIFLNRNCF